MGYIVLSRKETESVMLCLAPDADPAAALHELQKGIFIDVLRLKSRHIKIGIEAPDSVLVLRGELVK